MDSLVVINPTASITLPLDIVVEVLKAARGHLPEDTEALLKIEVMSALNGLPELSDEEVKQVMGSVFVQTPWGIVGP